jgi:hypothetical protein
MRRKSFHCTSVRPVPDHLGKFCVAKHSWILIIHIFRRAKSQVFYYLTLKRQFFILIIILDSSDNKCAEDTAKLNVCAQSMMGGKLLNQLCKSDIKSVPKSAMVRSNKAPNPKPKNKAAKRG